ncbi:hypothetical protein [Fodinicola acaciae]|uniref:hypothetical protein n=1 Tax=Fodinicola acaciae TaxID=2681555 RepID=UPI0013D6C61C|nr:hypothetical protein [Fodinicola acaciae]
MTEPSDAVVTAVAAVQAHFAGKPVEVLPDGAGGATVIVDHVDLGDRFIPSTTWLGFHISAAYPHADVYPHYIGRVVPADGQPLGDAVQPVDWCGRQALQLSRRSNRWNPAIDNAALKAEKVITWFTTK